ncbi:MAG: type I DNA topoisomerase [Bacteroidales bacterium]
MSSNLVIVESPAKAKTIEKFLGKDFEVVSSYGHIRDLEKKDFGVDLKNNYEPRYIISDDKKKVVRDLKKKVKSAKVVWLASDEDREGEAIAWHLAETLGVNNSKAKRIVFHEITKPAILKAIENPRTIDKNLVDAQQARRVLDRMVGFEVSPVLWRKVQPSLSAGRVQSVAVRLIVEREREIIGFDTTSAYRVFAKFIISEKGKTEKYLEAELQTRFKTIKEAEDFLEKCKNAKFLVDNVEKKPLKRSPAAPFTTSTLQQEASRKLGFSVSQTMSVAQRLYEAGKITYMRTDSVNLSELAVDAAKKHILERFGEKYLKIRKYTTKSKGAQEAHEAIRPTYMDKNAVSGTDQEKRLYDLIWKRTIASQISDAELEKTIITVKLDNDKHKFAASGEIIKFDGFLNVYIESSDDDADTEDVKGLLPPLKVGENLELASAEAIEKYTQKPPRYTEASLVKKLEEQGIGRPSTYAPTITTIQNRKYVVKEDREPQKRNVSVLKLNLKEQKIEKNKKKENFGAEKAKLFPTDIGMVVNDFLVEHFERIMEYSFTAKVEEHLDEVAEGSMQWQKMIDAFYKPFHKSVEEALENSERAKGERVLGEDPNTGKPISVKIGRYGAYAQLGEGGEEVDEKPTFAKLRNGQHIETITLEEALDLFKLPRQLGDYEGKVVTIGIGRFGPYVRHDNKFVSLEKDVDDPMTIDFDRAVELIENKREKDRKALIKVFEDGDSEIRILEGRWGPYISFNKKNYKIPKNQDPNELTLEKCKELIENPPKKKTVTKRKSAKNKK